MKISKYLVLLVMFLCVSSISHADIDWNTKDIQWNSYEGGLGKLKANNEIGLIILYADWCSVCKQYSKLFSSEKVVSALKDITVIKANAEKEVQVKHLKEYDEKYVPKTIIIDSSGNVVTELYGEKEDYMFFRPADDLGALLDIIKVIKEENVKRKSLKPNELLNE